MYQNNRNLFSFLAVLAAAGLITGICGLFLIAADQIGGGAKTISAPGLSSSLSENELASENEAATEVDSSQNPDIQNPDIQTSDTSTGAPIGTHTDTVLSVAISDSLSSEPLIASGSYDNSVKVWNTGEAAAQNDLAQNGRVNALAFVQSDYLALGSGSGEITLWNPTAQAPATRILGQSGRILSLAANEPGTRIASGSSNGTLKVWPLTEEAGTEASIDTAQAVTLTQVGPQIEAIAFYPTDSNRLVSGDHDGVLKVWDITKEESVLTLDGKVDRILGLAVSPDGQFVASGSKDSQIQIWNLETGDQIHTLSGHDFVVADVAFSPDGQFLASGSYDELIKLWDWAKEEELCTLEGHSGFVYTVAFADAGKRLISGGYDGSVRDWDLAACYAE